MKFKILKQENLFDHFFKVFKTDLSVDRFDGGQLEMTRFELQRPQAAALILENTDTDSLVLVEQFRYSSLSFNQNHGWTIEVIAGLIDAGETPEESVIREAFEETGYRVRQVEKIQLFAPSIGVSTEQVHLFYGVVRNQDKTGEGGGLIDENEDIRVVEWKIKDLFQAMKKGEIYDSKTLICAQWLYIQKHCDSPK